MGSSLIKVLLRNGVLQTKFLEVLVEKIHEISVVGEEDDILDGGVGEVPRLLLREIRWLEHVEDPKALTDKLLEVLDAAAAPLVLRREVGVGAAESSASATNALPAFLL